MEVRIMSSEDIFEMQILNQAKKIENEYKKEKERTQKLRKNFEILNMHRSNWVAKTRFCL